MRHLPLVFSVLLAGPAAAQIHTAPTPYPPAEKLTAPAKLQIVADFPDQQITGIAVSETGRMFVNLPRWSVDVPISVGEVKGGKITLFPRATTSSACKAWWRMATVRYGCWIPPLPP
jgi:hypothetical protein